MKRKQEKPKICKLCHKEIDTKKDRWCVIIDYVAEQETDRGYYHRFCLNDLIKAQGKVIAKNFEEKLQKFAGNILGKFLGKPREIILD